MQCLKLRNQWETTRCRIFWRLPRNCTVQRQTEGKNGDFDLLFCARGDPEILRSGVGLRHHTRENRTFKSERESIELGLIYAKKKKGKKVLSLPLSITPPSKKFTNYIEKVHHGFTILYFSVENFKLWAPYQIKKPIRMRRRTKVGRI